MLNARRIAAYYSAVTPLYDQYAGAPRGWHWGIWEPGVRTHEEALIRSNEALVRGLDLSSRARVLDVGCGVGGFAIWAARTFGCRVIGITICADHVRLAEEYAARSGVGDLCQFLPMDMDRLRFPGAEFDLVVNQESFCHSLDKKRYLSSVFEALKPTGAWRSIDWCLAAKGRPSAAFRRLRQTVYEGFQIPSCPSAERVEAYLEGAGFVGVKTVDVTKLVLPNQDRMNALPFALAKLFPQWCFPGNRSARSYCAGHYRAGFAFLEGLRHGYFSEVLYRARRPAARQATARNRARGRLGAPGRRP